jgi:hypothetical protein
MKKIVGPFRAGVCTLVLGCCAFTSGCIEPEPVQIDLSSNPIRFIIDHQGWPRPLWWPRITEFAIASEEDGQIWELHTEGSKGVLAREIGIVYGEVPPGFYQTFPELNKHPARLEMGRTYYVASGGSKALYRLAFSLPVERGIPFHAVRQPTTSHPDSVGP